MAQTITQIGMLIHVAQVQLVSARGRAVLPLDVAVDAEVDMDTTDGQSLVRVRLNVNLRDTETTRMLVDRAHRERPRWNATHGDVDVAPRSIGSSRG